MHEVQPEACGSMEQKKTAVGATANPISKQGTKRYAVIDTGWWLTYPSEKYEFVSWDDDIP